MQRSDDFAMYGFIYFKTFPFRRMPNIQKEPSTKESRPNFAKPPLAAVKGTNFVPQILNRIAIHRTKERQYYLKIAHSFQILNSTCRFV